MARQDRIFFVIGGCVALALTGVAGMLWFAGGIVVDEPDRAVADVSPRPIDPPQPELVHARYAEPDADELAASDPLVRGLIGELSSHPRVASWLVTDGLMRRFVAAVEAVGEGYSPRDELEFLRPMRPFVVREDEGRLVVAAGSFRRYDVATDVFVSFDIDGAVAVYRRLEPMLEEAHRQLSWGDEPFEDRLRAALDHLLEVPVPTRRIVVERQRTGFAYADRRLEHLSDAQRHLLRMGPGNATRIQAKLRQLRQAFGWPEPTDEPPQATDAASAPVDPTSEPVSVADLVVFSTPDDREGPDREEGPDRQSAPVIAATADASEATEVAPWAPALAGSAAATMSEP